MPHIERARSLALSNFDEGQVTQALRTTPPNLESILRLIVSTGVFLGLGFPLSGFYVQNVLVY